MKVIVVAEVDHYSNTLPVRTPSSTLFRAVQDAHQGSPCIADATGVDHPRTLASLEDGYMLSNLGSSSALYIAKGSGPQWAFLESRIVMQTSDLTTVVNRHRAS